MADEAAVFKMVLGGLDLLLPASDFEGLASVPESEAGTPAPAFLEAKDGRRERVALDRLLEGLFGAALANATPTEGESVAFLAKAAGDPKKAFVSRRPFEIVSFPVREFRLPPPGLRAGLAKMGLLAVRFQEGGKAQYLMDVGALAARGPERAARP